MTFRKVLLRREGPDSSSHLLVTQSQLFKSGFIFAVSLVAAGIERKPVKCTALTTL